jgi:hypothetical protein
MEETSWETRCKWYILLLLLLLLLLLNLRKYNGKILAGFIWLKNGEQWWVCMKIERNAVFHKMREFLGWMNDY